MNTKIKSLLALALCAVGLSAFAKEPDAVQLWEGGPYFATCNVGDGATVPGDYGALYTFDDNKAADAAASLGDGWRLPTKDELNALLSNCTTNWVTCKDSTGADRAGYRFTGKGDYSSNSIFLPAAGQDRGSDRESAGDEGDYWSSTKMNASIVYRLNFHEGQAGVNLSAGNLGQSVRAVRDTPLVTGPTVKVDSVTAGEPWSTITVNYTLGGVDAATDYKVAFDITAGGQTASVTNDAAKLTDGAATKEIDTAKLFGKQVVDTKAKVKVSLIAVKASSEPEYVEIGGVKWATKNLGAEKVTDCGDYFAWGATELAYSSLSSKTFTFVASRPASYGGSGWTQSSGFAKVNTPYYDGSAYTKYTSEDSKTVLESGDDAATALLGSGWRMPTSAEFKALYDACYNKRYDTTTNPSGASASVGKGVYWCTSYDGVAGCLFCDGTNKLFFPAAGNGTGTSLKDAGSSGCYRSSSLYTDNTSYAYNLSFYSADVNPQDYSFRHRYYGFSVRPVKEVK